MKRCSVDLFCGVCGFSSARRTWPCAPHKSNYSNASTRDPSPGLLCRPPSPLGEGCGKTRVGADIRFMMSAISRSDYFPTCGRRSAVRRRRMWPMVSTGRCKGMRLTCHSEPFDCHSERSEESQRRLREEPRCVPHQGNARSFAVPHCGTPQDDSRGWRRHRFMMSALHDCAGRPHTPILPKHGPLSPAGEGEGSQAAHQTCLEGLRLFSACRRPPA